VTQQITILAGNIESLVDRGYGIRQIAQFYDLPTFRIVQRLREIGRTAPFDAGGQIPDADERKIYVRRMVAAGRWGGLAITRISLPRVSMHVASMSEVRQ
jgi:hypothetical protein